MTTELAPHYLTDGGGNFYYPLGHGSDDVTAKAADGWINARRATAEGAPGRSWERTNWYVTREPVTEFAFPQPPVNKVIRYTLKDSTAMSTRYPLILSPAEYEAKRSAEDPDDDGETGLTYIMYRAVTEQVERDPFIVDVSSMTPMIGTADENGQWAWEVERTAGLLYGQWYHHLLPGSLYGVIDRLAKDLTEHYGKADFFGSRTGFSVDSRNKFTVSFNVPFDVPVFRHAPRYGRAGQKLKGTQQVAEFIPIRIEWVPGGKIAAKTKAEAVAVYDKYLADTIEWIDSHKVVACSHCKGHGYIETKGVKP